MKIDPNINQKTQQKTSKNHEKFNKIQEKTPPDRHLDPARAPGRSKYLKKTSVKPFYRILGVPWDPFGKPKISKKSKKWSLKIDEKSEGFKRARSFKTRSTMSSK